MKVYTYWHNLSEMPPFVSLCVRMMGAKFGEDFVLYERESFMREFSEVRADIWKLNHANGNPHHTEAMRSDYVRAHIIRRHGGFWIDADTIVVNDFLPDLVPLFEEHDYIARKNENGWYAMNFMGTRRDGFIINLFLKKQDEMLDRVMEYPPHTIDAGSLFGSRLLTSCFNPILTDAWEEIPRICYYVIGEEKVCPINFKNWKKYFDVSLEIEEFDLDNIYCFQMFNRVFPDEVREMSADEFLSQRWFVSRLMRKLIGKGGLTWPRKRQGKGARTSSR